MGKGINELSLGVKGNVGVGEGLREGWVFKKELWGVVGLGPGYCG